MRGLLIWICALLPALGQAEEAGDFDYWVLSLSWSPSWCAQTGDAQGADQCDARHDHGWTLHGLWPQYARGYPSFCQTAHPPPSRRQTAAMADVMGSAGLAWHQWRKHGSCSGFSAEDYFALSRRAYAQVVRPEAFRRLTGEVTLPASVVEEAFLVANPGWTAEMLTITCKDGRISEARLCLDRALAPVPCGPDIRRDCTLPGARLPPIR